MPGMRLWFQRPVRAIVNAGLGANKAQAGFYGRTALLFAGRLRARGVPELTTATQLFGRIRGTNSQSVGAIAAEQKEFQMKTKLRTSRLPAALPVKLHLAAAAIVLALLAIPHIGHAQGIVRGAQEGAYEGSRVAGPVGGVVGGAVGAGVGGAMGAVKGVFGIPDRGWRRGYRCRGYYDGYHRFHCIR